MNKNMKFGPLIRKLRIKKGLGQRELAIKIGIALMKTSLYYIIVKIDNKCQKIYYMMIYLKKKYSEKEI